MIIKKTKSGKGVLFTDDFGNTGITSKDWLVKFLLNETGKMPFVMLTRFPQPAQEGRFPKSPLLGTDGEHIAEDDPRWFAPQCPHNVLEENATNDALSNKGVRKREKKKEIEDKVVW